MPNLNQKVIKQSHQTKNTYFIHIPETLFSKVVKSQTVCVQLTVATLLKVHKHAFSLNICITNIIQCINLPIIYQFNVHLF